MNLGPSSAANSVVAEALQRAQVNEQQPFVLILNELSVSALAYEKKQRNPVLRKIQAFFIVF